MYLLDENLSPAIAQALRLFDWDIKTVTEVFKRQGPADKDIIDWLGKTGAIWLTEDVSARKQNEFLLKTRRVSVVWLKQPKKGLNAWEQFKILVRDIDRVAKTIRESSGAVHVRVSRNSTPSIWWRQKS